MKEENSKTSYEIVFESLLNIGYSEEEAGELLSGVIEEQRKFSKLACQLNQILKKDEQSSEVFYSRRLYS